MVGARTNPAMKESLSDGWKDVAAEVFEKLWLVLEERG